MASRPATVPAPRTLPRLTPGTTSPPPRSELPQLATSALTAANRASERFYGPEELSLTRGVLDSTGPPAAHPAALRQLLRLAGLVAPLAILHGPTDHEIYI